MSATPATNSSMNRSPGDLGSIRDRVTPRAIAVSPIASGRVHPFAARGCQSSRQDHHRSDSRAGDARIRLGDAARACFLALCGVTEW